MSNWCTGYYLHVHVRVTILHFVVRSWYYVLCNQIMWYWKYFIAIPNIYFDLLICLKIKMVYACNIYLWWNRKYIWEKPLLFSILFFVIHVYVLRCFDIYSFIIIPALCVPRSCIQCHCKTYNSVMLIWVHLIGLFWNLSERSLDNFGCSTKSNKAEVEHDGMMCLDEV